MTLKNDKVPERLYRYRALGGADYDKYLEPILTKARLYFPSRAQLNDPFECIAPEFRRTPELEKLVRSAVNKELAVGRPRNERRVIKRNALKRDFLEGVQQETQDMLDRAGILSFSAVPDEILLWSHYTNGHRGICLEFESGLLGFSRPISEVHYLNFRPEFDASIEGDERTRRLILSKYEGWRYEQEWRVIYGAEKGISYGEHPFDPKSLTAIIFGCATTESDKDKVREWVKKGSCKPEFRQAIRRKGAFAIDIKSL
jgi:hypothetical protein